jgi:hypothetical protein
MERTPPRTSFSGTGPAAFPACFWLPVLEVVPPVLQATAEPERQWQATALAPIGHTAQDQELRKSSCGGINEEAAKKPASAECPRGRVKNFMCAFECYMHSGTGHPA